VLDYDQEARCYDATRGGDARAGEAARAIGALIPAGTAGAGRATDRLGSGRPGLLTVADIGCGTGIVTVRLQAPGRKVIGVDRSAGMAAVAAARLPGLIMLGTAARLPFAPASVDVITMVWLLHLLDEAASAAAIAEAARVLRPGGHLISTVAKNDAETGTTSDTAAIVAPVRARYLRPATDAPARMTELAAGHGLRPAGRATFTGIGQGRSPRWWQQRLRGGERGWAQRAGPGQVASLCARLAALPGQDQPRADPVYQVMALRKEVPG
jgi:SAM-dependent methyltransferase